MQFLRLRGIVLLVSAPVPWGELVLLHCILFLSSFHFLWSVAIPARC